jgi:DNA-binding response OmpR family regulator
MVVRLPLGIEDRALPSRPPETGEAATAPTTLSRRILIVDDNKDAADSMALLVETAGHRVRTAYDGEEALDLASAFAPDVLLLDLGVPGLNGFEIARRIRGQPWGKTVSLIAVTGWGQEHDRRRTAEAGFDAHLIKPVGTADLLSALKACRQPARHISEAP